MTPQNFSIPAGYKEQIAFTVDPALELAGTTIWWRVYTLQFGVPNFGYLSLGSPSAEPLIEKTSTSPGDVTVIESPPGFSVQMHAADTIGLLRNYYYEATIVDADQQVIGGLFGIMTVASTTNRQSGITS